MTTLHPHWQATDDSDDRHVPIRIVTEGKMSPPQMHLPVKQASRRPAAFVGIFLCVIAGVAAFQGFVLSDIQGQVQTPPVDVHIRPIGADPVTITVQPGVTIRWTNDDTIPHVLSSDTLPTANGQPFMTSAIFPGSTIEYVVPATITPGSYAYISKTAETVSGLIIVQASGNVPSGQTQNPFSLPGDTNNGQSSSIPVVQTQPSSVPAIPTPIPVAATVSDILPVNAHTVGNGEQTLPPRQGTTPTTEVTTHVPKAAPSTGPEVWVTVLLTIVALLFVTRRAFRAI